MVKKFLFTTFSILSIFMLIVMGAGKPLSAAAAPSMQDEAPTITSDLADYPPGATVTLTGANWQGDTDVRIVVNDDVGQTWSRDVIVPVAGDGTIYDSFNLPSYFVATYRVVASGQQTGRAVTYMFTDKPAANLDQCANLGTTCDTGTSSQWQNGNLGQSQATYFEGDSVPYRTVFTGLEAGETYTVVIEYDTTQSGKHAIDYLTSFDRTETTADPCTGVAGVPSCTASTFPIPLDPNVSGAGVTQLGGQVFTIYNGTITGTSAYTLTGTYAGSSSTSITVTFTASADGTTILAWGGHIATRADWGANNSAVAISGSPYHMRLVDFTCSNVSNCGVGNQDRSLSAEAVIFPGSITIIKDATPNGPTSFPFTGSPSPLTDFSLVDDGTTANTIVFSNITTFTTYTVNETPIPAGWNFVQISCQVTSPNGGSATPSGTSVDITLAEGENWTCTYTDAEQTPTPTNTATNTATPTNTATNTPTNTPTDTPTPTATDTPTNTPTDTPTPTATDTPTNTPTDTPTPTATDTPTNTPTDTPTPTATDTPTNTPTDTPTPTATDTPTNTPTDTPTPTATDTPTNTPTDTPTPTATDTPTNTPTDTPTPTATDTPTNTPTKTATNTPTNTPTKTPTPTQANLGQLKVCKIAGAGVTAGTIFTIAVNGTPYNVPAGKDGGLCVLAGQFPLNTQVTVQETIPAGYFVSRIEVKPDGRVVSKNVTLGKVVIKIGTGVTEVIFTNRAAGTPTATPKPTRTPGAPTATAVPPTGRLQICKEADGTGVTGNFTFTFAGKTRTIPVGTCTSLISVPVGSLTITEVARAGYVVSDIYTIPADRLISEDWAARTATVTIVQGNASTQTIVIFRNRAQTTQTNTDMAMSTYTTPM